MVLLPAGVAVAVGLLLRLLGTAAVVLACAVFFAVQLLVLARSQRRLTAARLRLSEARSRQRRLRDRG
jgi:uncharacterized membrane protein YbaN (DUF454 family)